ncbi:microtubule-associated protein 10-like [Nylanderia fulva]|uniref:microtubule-associated protein 10-like n=1 Tax=Nylanderia fulva TaxID=613905 RepID=UPI0010FB0057|nr:microtubule-associated protein 10-like [Nylanderia fulva]
MENAIKGEQLFLLEFLVDKVNIPAIKAIHEEILPSRTCISFQILDLPPLNIYQESPTEACACIEDGPQVFKKGKSCLFALANVVLQKQLCNFPVTMSVYKELPPGVLPDVMLIGTHQIQIRDLINSLVSQRNFQNGSGCRILKDTFKITTATGQCVGKVTVFIRASCFGRKIVTQFQIPQDKEPYLFKGAEDSPVFQCKRITSATDREQWKYPKKTGDGSGEAAKIYCPDERRRRKPKDIDEDKCAPCCSQERKSRETVRKCGCVIVKKERTCSYRDKRSRKIHQEVWLRRLGGTNMQLCSDRRQTLEIKGENVQQVQRHVQANHLRSYSIIVVLITLCQHQRDRRSRKTVRKYKRSKKTVSKCGCVVKEKRTLSCVRTNVRRLK